MTFQARKVAWALVAAIGPIAILAFGFTWLVIALSA